MAIQFKKETGVFVLETKRTVYQMIVGDYGVLRH